ncbi:MAG TPA: S1/P1 nuclease [Desulfomonilaceae bacterium]|nr:S1/P1 nuclease [Desulfomonilaceae bacterium]
MRAVIAFLSGICFLMTTTTGLAWNKSGHMISAAIAYADLKERNPAVITKIIEVLKQHPDFQSMWSDQLSQVDDPDLCLIMLAARWPDDIKKQTHKYNHWHYVNIPYRPGTNGVLIPQGESIVTAFPDKLSIAKSQSANDKDRAVALCWMLHLIGDVHQPLHTIALITEQFPGPKGDEGGNLFFIRERPNSSTKDLHALWDDLISTSEEFRTVLNKAGALRNKPDMKRDNFTEQLAIPSFNDWAVATYKVAIELAYLNGTLKTGTEDDGAVLPSGYKDKAHEVAERQIVLSGYRIGDAMVEVFGK